MDKPNQCHMKKKNVMNLMNTQKTIAKEEQLFSKLVILIRLTFADFYLLCLGVV